MRILSLIKKIGNSLPSRKGAGYTLVELLTVSAIISILAGISFALLSRMKSQVIESKAIAGLNVIATGYEMYFNRYMEYPQWGPGCRFDSPKALWENLAHEEFVPRSYGNYEYDNGTGYIYNVIEDYALEIPMYDPGDPTIDQELSFFVVCHPYNFQRDALAIGINPPTGWVAVRPRKGEVQTNFRLYQLYIPHRGGME
jgi:prepilin-type N-terminal cleavage/methylation domain-containing protein